MCRFTRRAALSLKINLPIEIDVEELTAESVSPKHPVTLMIETTSADNALWLLLEPLHLRYMLEDNTIVVCGASSAPINAVVYNIADLLKHDLNWLEQPEIAVSTHDSPEARAAATLVAAIAAQIQPESWKQSGGRGAIEAFLTNHSLVVSHTEPVHRKVYAFLAETRQRLDIRPEFPQKPPLHLVRTKKHRHNVNTYSRVYYVADLVIPVPSAEGESNADRRFEKVPAADFDTLINLITSTIAPDSWEPAGGFANIEPFPTNLSLVISQTEMVHEQIANLLEQLRRLQDLQITLETRVLHVPKTMFDNAELPSSDVADSTLPAATKKLIAACKQVTLSEIETSLLLHATQGENRENVLTAPKVTLFNGQHVTMNEMPHRASMQLGAVCSDDRKSVYLRVTTDATAEFTSIPMVSVPTGSSVLLPISDPEAFGWVSAEGERVETNPILEKIPYYARLFKKTVPHIERKAFLLVTPRVIEVAEGEAALSPSSEE